MSATGQVNWREHVVGRTYLNRVEREGNNPSYSTGSREGREISQVVSMMRFVPCGGGSRFKTGAGREAPSGAAAGWWGPQRRGPWPKTPAGQSEAAGPASAVAGPPWRWANWLHRSHSWGSRAPHFGGPSTLHGTVCDGGTFTSISTGQVNCSRRNREETLESRLGQLRSPELPGEGPGDRRGGSGKEKGAVIS